MTTSTSRCALSSRTKRLEIEQLLEPFHPHPPLSPSPSHPSHLQVSKFKIEELQEVTEEIDMCITHHELPPPAAGIPIENHNVDIYVFQDSGILVLPTSSYFYPLPPTSCYCFARL